MNGEQKAVLFKVIFLLVSACGWLYLFVSVNDKITEVISMFCVMILTYASQDEINKYSRGKYNGR